VQFKDIRIDCVFYEKKQKEETLVSKGDAFKQG
jgi:hypothetical protein